MPLKLGNRVTVLPGVSPCKDTGSLQECARQAARTGIPDLATQGADRSHLVGKRGEVVQIGTDGPCTCPDPSMVLIDDQVVNGVRVGQCTMREWLFEHEVELG